MNVAEVFPREAASNPEAFTGERLTSALGGQAQIEHYHRYLFARGLCAGLDVLDVASGEGYGAAQIAQVARSVVGLEYSAPTVRSATGNFPRGNLRFLQGDARAMPLPDRSFDVVVSFETIEHFDRQEDFLAEVHRVLRPGGCFIVSTPDRDVYSAPGMTPNPFHVKEMSRDEFAALLLSTFRHARCHHQRPVIGSVIVGEQPGGLPPLIVDRPDASRFQAGSNLPRAPYIIAVASDDPVAPLPESVFINRDDLDTDSLALAQRTAELEAARADLAEARADLERTRREIEDVRQEANDVRRDADARLTALAKALEQTRGSIRVFLKHYLPRLFRPGGEAQRR
jgi:O-antigen biosynthesis protein